MGERHDVIRHGCLADYPGRSAITAEWLDAETAQALGNSAAPTRPKCQPKLRQGIPSRQSTAGGNTPSAGLTSLDEQR